MFFTFKNQGKKLMNITWILNIRGATIHASHNSIHDPDFASQFDFEQNLKEEKVQLKRHFITES